jgi:hypothetical protein
LIIPAAASVELRRDVAYFIVKHPIDERVHIFIG